MKYAFSNNGISWRAIENDWALLPGEVVFDHIATEDELLAAFPGYLSIVRSAQAVVIDSACAAVITGGFTSAALGKPHTYPSNPTDQANLAANVLSSMYPSLPGNWTTPQNCCDVEGVWAYRSHTAAQIQQVGLDGKATILGYLIKKAGLQMQIDAAGDMDSIQKVVW